MSLKIVGTRLVSAALRELASRRGLTSTGPVKVDRQQIPYWQQQGWQQKGNQFTGSYQTPYGAFYGEVVRRAGSFIDFFLYDPPQKLRSHSHWACFQDRGQGWYMVHMSRKPADVSSGILAIERLLTEALER